MARYINPFTDFGFKHLFESAELANLPRPSQMEYEESLKQLRDLKNVLRTAEQDAAKKADAKARKEEQEKAKKQNYQNVKEALEDGFTIKQVIKLFKVTEEEVLKIKNNQL